MSERPDVIEIASEPILHAETQGITIVDRVCGRIRPGEPLVLRPLTQDRWVTYATIHPRGARPTLEQNFVQSMREFVTAERDSAPEVADSLRLISTEPS